MHTYAECLTPFGRYALFRAEMPDAGSELWRTDGTLEGTARALDLNPGAASSTPGCGSVIGNRVFFTAWTSEHGREYWRSDGTLSGTDVFDLWPGARSGAQEHVDNRDYQAAVGSRVFFTAQDGVHGRELWVTDGTREGTSMLKDIRSGPEGSSPFQMRAVGGRVFFSADDGEHGRELWTSDGTRDGTRLVADIVPGGENSDPQLKNSALGFLFFSAHYKLPGFPTPSQLFFRSDGTRNGTVRLGDWNASRGVEFDDLNYFERCSGCSDEQLAGLWATDGSPPGTVAVRSSLRVLSTPVVARSRLFFAASDGQHGYELWSSDGTAESTRMVHDTKPGSESSYDYELTAVGEFVVFEGDDGVHGAEPWLSDGAAAGTRLAADVNPGPNASWPRAFTLAGGRVYFVSNRELWVLTGTP